MAIQLPKVERIAPVGPTGTEPVRGEGVDTATAIGKVGNSIAGVAATMADYFEKEEKAAASDAQLAAINRFKERETILREGGSIRDAAGNETKFLGARNTEGDPTEVYKEYNDHMVKFRDEILNSGENWSERTRAAVTRGLTEAYNDMNLKNLTYEGSQYAKYRQAVTDTAAKNMYGDVMDSTIYMRAEDPSTFAPFDESIAKIRNLRIAEGIKNGSVAVVSKDYQPKKGEFIPLFVDEDGVTQRVKISDMTKYQIAQDLNASVPPAIDNMISAGRLDIAKVMLEKYGDSVEPTKLQKLNEEFKKQDKKQQAYSLFGKLQGKPLEAKEAAIGAIEDKEVQEKVTQLLNDHERQMKDMERRRSDENYGYVMNMVGQMKRSGGLVTLSEMEANADFVKRMNTIVDPKKKEAIYAMFESKKKSDPKALNRVHKAIADGSFWNMDEGDLNVTLAGLSDADRKSYTGRWVTSKQDTEGNQRARLSAIQRQVYNRAMAIPGFIERDPQNPSRPSRKGLERLGNLQNRVSVNADQFPKNMPQKEIGTWVDDYIVGEANQKQSDRKGGWLGNMVDSLFGVGRTQIQSDRRAIPPTQRGQQAPAEGGSGGTKKKPMSKLSDKEVMDARKRFREINGRAPKNAAELNTFLESEDGE